MKLTLLSQLAKDNPHGAKVMPIVIVLIIKAPLWMLPQEQCVNPTAIMQKLIQDLSVTGKLQMAPNG
jgi:hypothetical protein